MGLRTITARYWVGWALASSSGCKPPAKALQVQILPGPPLRFWCWPSILSDPMTLDNVTLPLALAAGAASFLSPCVLPLVPVYVSYLARTPAGDGAAPANHWRLSTFASAVAFVIGVSVILIALFYALRSLLQPVRDVVTPLAGVLVILFALHLAGLLRLPGMDPEFRLFKTAPRFTEPLGGFLLRLTFSAASPPSTAPVLSSIPPPAATPS